MSFFMSAVMVSWLSFFGLSVTLDQSCLNVYFQLQLRNYVQFS